MLRLLIEDRAVTTIYGWFELLAKERAEAAMLGGSETRSTLLNL